MSSVPVSIYQCSPVSCSLDSSQGCCVLGEEQNIWLPHGGLSHLLQISTGPHGNSQTANHWPTWSPTTHQHKTSPQGNMAVMSPMISHSVVSNSLQLHGPQPTRFFCLWNSPGKHTGGGCYFLLQGIFLTQRSNPSLLHLLHWQGDSLPPRHLGCILATVKQDTVYAGKDTINFMPILFISLLKI